MGVSKPLSFIHLSCAVILTNTINEKLIDRLGNNSVDYNIFFTSIRTQVWSPRHSLGKSGIAMHVLLTSVLRSGGRDRRMKGFAGCQF